MVNLAQVGCGYWGPNLLRNLSSNTRCRMRYVCDTALDRREYVAANYPGVTPTEHFDMVLRDSAVDGVVIATPAALHFEQAMVALEAGKHVLVEKPMARSVDEVASIRDKAASKGLVAMAGHTFLYNAAVRYLKELVRSGSLGDVLYLYSQRLNLGRIRQDVDALWNLAPHDISIIQYLLDDPAPVRVRRAGMDYMQPGVDDIVFLNVEYPNKVLANIQVSWLDPQKVRRLTVVGSRKMVVYDDLATNKITIYDKGIDRVESHPMDFDANDFFRFTHRSGDILMPQINWLEPLKTEIDHFIDCIQGNAHCETDAQHALGVVRILEAASTSKESA